MTSSLCRMLVPSSLSSCLLAWSHITSCTNLVTTEAEVRRSPYEGPEDHKRQWCLSRAGKDASRPQAREARHRVVEKFGLGNVSEESAATRSLPSWYRRGVASAWFGGGRRPSLACSTHEHDSHPV